MNNYNCFDYIFSLFVVGIVIFKISFSERNLKRSLIFKLLFSSTSKKTGFAFKYKTGLTEPTNDIEGNKSHHFLLRL